MNKESDKSKNLKKLILLRKKITRLDAKIIESLAQRVLYAKEIGVLKKELNVKILDKKRENEVKELHMKMAKKYNVSVDFIENLFKLIMSEARNVQKQKKL